MIRMSITYNKILIIQARIVVMIVRAEARKGGYQYNPFMSKRDWYYKKAGEAKPLQHFYIDSFYWKVDGKIFGEMEFVQPDETQDVAGYLKMVMNLGRSYATSGNEVTRNDFEHGGFFLPIHDFTANEDFGRNDLILPKQTTSPFSFQMSFNTPTPLPMLAIVSEISLVFN